MKKNEAEQDAMDWFERELLDLDAKYRGMADDLKALEIKANIVHSKAWAVAAMLVVTLLALAATRDVGIGILELGALGVAVITVLGVRFLHEP